MKVLTVVGARPQFVKAFPVSKRLRERHEEVLVHTGQHYDDELSAVFFEELDIPAPDYNLGIGSGRHGQQTAAMMAELEPLVDREAPDVVLVYGDTNSTLAAAVVAAKTPPRLAHVEAGLRSHNRSMPEETNRVLTDHAADLLFAPSPAAVSNLRDEGIVEGVSMTGDVMYDAVLLASAIGRERSTALDRLDLDDGAYVLATVHRAGNTDDPERLAGIVEGLAGSPLPVVFPAHPRTVAALKSFDLWERARSTFAVIEPVGYLDFIRLVSGAERVATDSGGVQKEAFYLDTPCVTLRDETEWVETVERGGNVIVGADADRIRDALRVAREPPTESGIYGEGQAAAHIVEALSDG